ncbi:hypothetical protein PCK2_000074 [Pneumocystis canis]|nr:hypothetical protein PCK2_000074 [Pneumocystis canis]
MLCRNQDDNGVSETQELQKTSNLEFQKKDIDVESVKENISESHSSEASEDTQLENNSEKVDTPIEPSSIAPPFEIFDNDQTLKSLLMSWYYAGYYTGYYMGQDSIRNKKIQN